MSVDIQAQSANDRLGPAREAFRSLLLHVQDSPAGLARLGAAVDLARRLDATVAGVAAEAIDPMIFSGWGVNGEVLMDLKNALAEGFKRAERAFREQSAGLETEWRCIEDAPINAVLQAARSADLIVASRRATPTGAVRQCDAGQLVLKSGRPVLLIPDAGGTLAAEAIVVAWKDTREARRAVADALPFLRSAREVLVMEVCHPAEGEQANRSAAAVADHLKRHGVKAHAKARLALDVDTAVELQIAASTLGADLIVAGGYGHSRIGEWVLGGVTQDLLSMQQGFLLLSH